MGKLNPKATIRAICSHQQSVTLLTISGAGAWQ